MGGVPTVAVNCADLTTADAIDGTIGSYINDGLIAENMNMLYYSWYWFAMYFWHLNVWSYISNIEAIALCGISNGVDDAVFNQEWMDTVFYPVMLDYSENIWYLSEYWWATSLIVIFPYFGWVVLIINIIFMLDFNMYAMEYNARLLGDAGAVEGGEEGEEEAEE